jgi:sugar phosphate isomerase/epimerase
MGFPRDRALEQIADTTKRLADRAGKDNLFIVVEHLNRGEGNIIETFREEIELAEKVNHPRIRGFVDYYHLGIGNENFDLLREKISFVEHAHYANLLGRTIPVANRHDAEGVQFLKLMKELGYQGGMSVEGFAKDMNEFPGCAAFMKRFA